MKKLFLSFLSLFILLTSSHSIFANSYTIDTKGAHAFIQFRVKHLGYSWLYGRFNDFSGSFVYDENDASKNSINLEIDTASIDSNHAERDNHLRSKDFLNTKSYPKATFVSTEYIENTDNTATLKGDLTLHGVTKNIEISIEKIGGGKDPWGGYRQGFEGRTSFLAADFGMDFVKKLGSAAATVEMMLTIEGIKQ